MLRGSIGRRCRPKKINMGRVPYGFFSARAACDRPKAYPAHIARKRAGYPKGSPNSHPRHPKGAPVQPLMRADGAPVPTPMRAGPAPYARRGRAGTTPNARRSSPFCAPRARRYQPQCAPVQPLMRADGAHAQRRPWPPLRGEVGPVSNTGPSLRILGAYTLNCNIRCMICSR